MHNAHNHRANAFCSSYFISFAPVVLAQQQRFGRSWVSLFCGIFRIFGVAHLERLCVRRLTISMIENVCFAALIRAEYVQTVLLGNVWKDEFQNERLGKTCADKNPIRAAGKLCWEPLLGTVAGNRCWEMLLRSGVGSDTISCITRPVISP